MIKHLIWDTDNVLFETQPAVTYAICQSLNEMGYTIALNVVDRLAHQSLDYCVESLAARFQLSPYLLRQRSAQHYHQISPDRQMPFPGVLEVCAWSVRRGGLNLIATARGLDSTLALLAAHGMTDLFADIFCTEQGYPCKPNPSILLVALEKYALDPSEIMLVGHCENDIQAGQAAKVATCLFGEAEVSSLPSLQVSNFFSLLTFLEDQSGLD